MEQRELEYGKTKRTRKQKEEEGNRTKRKNRTRIIRRIQFKKRTKREKREENGTATKKNGDVIFSYPLTVGFFVNHVEVLRLL